MTSHRINLAELEVIVDARGVGEQLLERLSLLRERRIAPLLDRVCDEVSGPERIDRFDRIELELGSIALADFDDDFIRKLEAALRKALAKAVPAQDDAQARVQSALELLEVFAWTGNLPWWADANSSDPVRAQLDALLVAAPHSLLELLGELAIDKAALTRVLRHVDAQALAKLLSETLEPPERDASASIDGEQALLRELTNETRLAERVHVLLQNAVSASGAAHATGRSNEESHSSTLAEHDPATDPHQPAWRGARASTEEHPANEQREHSGPLLRDLAEDRNLPTWTVRELERAAVGLVADRPELPTGTEAARESLRPHVPLRELAEQPQLTARLHALVEALVAASQTGADVSSDESSSSTSIRRSHEIERASETEQPANARTSTFEVLLRESSEQPEIAERLHTLLRAVVAAGRAALEGSGRSNQQPRSSTSVERIRDTKPDRHAHPGLERLSLDVRPGSEQGETFEWLLRDLTEDRRLLVWIVHELERASTNHERDDRQPPSSSVQPPQNSRSHAPLLHRLVVAGDVEPAVLDERPDRSQVLDPEPRSSDARAAERPSPTRAARRRAVARLEEIYVDNAGVVLLWPFLTRFFARVGLLDERHRFLDEPARMQAIALLECLAREDLDPPEFRLPLAKLLCGLAPIDEFELEHPLVPEQLAECEHLLAAVIDNAPILRAMSVPGFCASFLLRPAVLGIRDGSWLLQVERASHDVVLEHFPWSWDWVKLAWMPDALRVDW